MRKIKDQSSKIKIGQPLKRSGILLCGLYLMNCILVSAQTTVTYSTILRSNVGTDTMWDGVSFRIYGMTPALSATVRLPADILYANEGDTLVLNARSISQNEHHTVHLHGMDEDTRNDGDPSTSFYLVHTQDTTYTAVCTHAGTFLYHCHVADVVHVQMGMYGLVVVRAANGAPNAWTNGPYIHQDYKWLTSEIDRSWHDTIPFHDLVVDTVNIPPYHPDYFLVNGKAQQEIAADDSIRIHGMVGEPIYVRLANIGFYSNRAVFPSWLHAKIIDSDGRPLPSEIISDTVEVMPGERFGVLLQPSSEDSGFVEMQYVNMNTAQSEHSEFIPVNVRGQWSGLKNIKEEVQFQVFPNPSSSSDPLQLEVDNSLVGKEIEVLDITGKVMSKEKIVSAKYKLSIGQLASGIYLLKIQTEKGILIRKLVRYESNFF
jgi:FtsP/CotA-like multicopper oxidase with cupredoxin domain